MQDDELSTHEKALRINIDANRYGTFAEIGAAQEVARWFFRVGGAAGTVAKTMSAYDMAFSDAIYGPAERYVSRERLLRMLEHEYALLLERLSSTRAETTSFFAFADTVVARSYRGTAECHGWMGIRFQPKPQHAPCDILLHVRMLDRTTVQQQEALGIVGVNLVYGAFYLREDPIALIDSLLDGLSQERMEIDMVKFEGAEFVNVDNRILSLHLVTKGLTEAAMFSACGEILQPSEALYGKSLLIERGAFRPVTNVNLAMLESARRAMRNDPETDEEIFEVMEITMHNLLREGSLDPADFLARVDILSALGKTVLISKFAEFHRLAAYLSRATREQIGIVLGIALLREVLDEKYYADLEGGILESMGRLFKRRTRLYVYPARDQATGELITADTIKIPDKLRGLYTYLRDNRYVEALDPEELETEGFSSRRITELVAAGDPRWKTMVPPEAVEMIEMRGYFRYHA
jgi:hypothetical protein